MLDNGHSIDALRVSILICLFLIPNRGPFILNKIPWNWEEFRPDTSSALYLPSSPEQRALVSPHPHVTWRKQWHALPGWLLHMPAQLRRNSSLSTTSSSPTYCPAISSSTNLTRQGCTETVPVDILTQGHPQWVRNVTATRCVGVEIHMEKNSTNSKTVFINKYVCAYLYTHTHIHSHSSLFTDFHIFKLAYLLKLVYGPQIDTCSTCSVLCGRVKGGKKFKLLQHTFPADMKHGDNFLF